MPRVSDAKQRLTEAAMALIWENSYGCTSVDDICERAGVKKGSFYYFFESKSDLAVAALEADYAAKKPLFDQLFSPTAPPLDRFRSYFKYVIDKQERLKAECGSVLGCPLFSIGAEVCTQEQAIRAKVEEILQRYVKYFESAIRDGQAEGVIPGADSHFKAQLLFTFFQGSLTQARISNRLEPLQDLIAGVWDLLGVKTEATAGVGA